jgi:hypothetical protein
VLCEKFFRTLQHPPTLSSPPAKPFGLTLRLSQLAAVSGCSAVISEAHDCSTAFRRLATHIDVNALMARSPVI